MRRLRLSAPSSSTSKPLTGIANKHITPRYSEVELAKILEPMRYRLEALEIENKRLRDAEKS